MSFRCLIVLFFLAAGFIAVPADIPYAAHADDSSENGRNLYRRYCSPCHGIKGDGKGFNAKNLDPRPASHADRKLMKKRTNDELYDVIEGGGRSAGKSTLMPPWGNTFSESRMKSLVLYMRKLCRCQGGNY